MKESVAIVKIYFGACFIRSISFLCFVQNIITGGESFLAISQAIAQELQVFSLKCFFFLKSKFTVVKMFM